MLNVQRALLQKPARHLIVLYICVKFLENISDGTQADTDGSADRQTDGWTSRKMYTSVSLSYKVPLCVTDGQTYILTFWV